MSSNALAGILCAMTDKDREHVQQDVADAGLIAMALDDAGKSLLRQMDKSERLLFLAAAILLLGVAEDEGISKREVDQILRILYDVQEKDAARRRSG